MLMILILAFCSHLSFAQEDWVTSAMARSHELTVKKYQEGNLEFIKKLCSIAHSDENERAGCVATNENLKGGDFFAIPIHVCKSTEVAAKKLNCFDMAAENLKRFDKDMDAGSGRCRIQPSISDRTKCMEDLFFAAMKSAESPATASAGPGTGAK
jgi:hypothetical protein